MIPTRIAPEANCERIAGLASQWKLDAVLALKLHLLAPQLPFGISIISDYRTADEQAALAKKPGVTAARDDLSTHRSCPPTGADIKVHVPLTDAVKRKIGAAAAQVGLRWGGGARRENGIPIGNEWAHLDMGPRQ